MQDSEILIEIAKLDGWQFAPEFVPNAAASATRKTSKGIEMLMPWEGLPDYLNSRDSVLSVIEKQPQGIKEAIAINLWEILGIDSDWSEQEAWAKNFSTTAQQYCEALLKTTGRWKD